MKSRNATSRAGQAGAGAVVSLRIAQDEHRAAKALHQAAGNNTKHSQVPVLSRKDQRRSVQTFGLLLALLKDGFYNFALHLLPFTVQDVQLFSECSSPLFVPRKPEFHYVPSRRHAAGSVDAGR